ncbi:MAG TPA: hypothetical protein VIS07_21130 [Candidatus Binatia bacterium]
MTAILAPWVGAALLTAALATPASGTSPGHRASGGGRHVAPRVVLPNPAGPTPRNPAGPTPLNPAGPTPLNPTGRAPVVSFPRTVIAPPSGVHVGIVGQQDVLGAPLGASFYCQVHDRGYASEALFFDHLAAADGIGSEEALAYIFEDAGVWVFPAE